MEKEPSTYGVLDDGPDHRQRRGFFPRALGALSVALIAFSATVVYLPRGGRDRSAPLAHLKSCFPMRD